jgi:hypothetical protein
MQLSSNKAAATHLITGSYGILVLGGGLLGFINAGSVPSLVSGVGTINSTQTHTCTVVDACFSVNAHMYAPIPARGDYTVLGRRGGGNTASYNRRVCVPAIRAAS